MEAKTRKIPTADEVMAQQLRDAAPKAVAAPTPATAPKPNGGNAVVTAKVNLPTTGLDAVENYVAEIASSMVVGTVIKFSKEGKHIRRDTEEEISPETGFVFHAPQVVAGYQKFATEEGEETQRIMGMIYEGFVVPPVSELPDRDESQWPEGLSGRPEDPWKHTIFAVLQQAGTDEMFTFITNSKTGRRAVGELLRHYNRMRKSHPGELPVVRLKVGGFQAKDERVGWVKTPVFVVVGRVKEDSAEKPDTSLGGEMNDQIPF
jgi:hypothetical protein